MAFVSHHRSIASVHCSATSYRARPCRAHTSSQYTTPVESASSSPETVATPASSSNARPCSNIAVQDEQPGFGHTSDGARRRVTPRTHLDGAPGPLPGAWQVAAQHPLVGPHDPEPGVRRRLLPTFEEPLGPSQPATHRRHQRRVEQQVHRQTNRRTGSGDLITSLDAGGVGAFPRLDRHLEMTGRVRDLTKHRQIGGSQDGRPRPPP